MGDWLFDKDPSAQRSSLLEVRIIVLEEELTQLRDRLQRVEEKLGLPPEEPQGVWAELLRRMGRK